jgi:small nuclear ribonucleoprotein (snRNP)-like protein
VSRKQFLASKVRQRIVVNLTDDSSIRGVLLDVHADCIVLAQAEALAPDASVPIDGETLILRERVKWVQVLAETTT